MARPVGSAELIEARRRQALRLLDAGYSLGEVGRMTGCAASSVARQKASSLAATAGRGLGCILWLLTTLFSASNRANRKNPEGARRGFPARC